MQLSEKEMEECPWKKSSCLIWSLRVLSFYLLLNREMVDKNQKPVVYRSDMEEFLGTSMQLLNQIYLKSLQHSVDSSVNVKCRFDKVAKNIRSL